MNIIKCKRGHYYDSDKLMTCPQCATIAACSKINDPAGQSQSQLHTAPVTTKDLKVRHKKTVGWLVCLTGELCGESFPLREQINYIGRDSHMDISLYSEPTVSREKHAAISYNAEKNRCVLKRSCDANQILLNGKTVKKERILHNRDLLTLGSCTLLFVALCDSTFAWTESES